LRTSHAPQKRHAQGRLDWPPPVRTPAFGCTRYPAGYAANIEPPPRPGRNGTHGQPGAENHQVIEEDPDQITADVERGVVQIAAAAHELSYTFWLLAVGVGSQTRSEEHTSELQSR